MAELVLSSMSKPHIVLFPFMAKGHTIPLLHLARLLVSRNVFVTIFTTPANRQFITDSLTGTVVSIVTLPFPENMPEIPPGIESTDKLPSMSLFIPFVNGLRLMQPDFEQAIEKIQSEVTCIVSDGFLHWTLESATRFSIPRLCFYGISMFAVIVFDAAWGSDFVSSGGSDDEPLTLPAFPWIRITRSDFIRPSDMRDIEGPYSSFETDMSEATSNSYGMVGNTFYDLEPTFADYWNREQVPYTWQIGPLCIVQNNNSLPSQKPEWIHWLDQKLAQNCHVLYVAFGSQAELSPEQMHELVVGLERSKVSFLWVLRSGQPSGGFENTVKGRGLIVKEWVDQKQILEHEAVQGFLSHCGWNSVLEGICAEVPILAWPMLAEQGINAIMVADEIRVGLRVNTVNGLAKGFVTGESLKNSVRELMEGENRMELKGNVMRLAEAARRAVTDGGSSSNDLDKLIEELHIRKNKTEAGSHGRN